MYIYIYIYICMCIYIYIYIYVVIAASPLRREGAWNSVQQGLRIWPTPPLRLHMHLHSMYTSMSACAVLPGQSVAQPCWSSNNNDDHNDNNNNNNNNNIMLLINIK